MITRKNLKDNFSNNNLLFFLFISAISFQFIAVALENWNLVFDDSYISYRYAMNLSEGYGLTWNTTEAPTEGYTNLLLVLVLAPFINMGLDPLFITRLLSMGAIIGIITILFRAVKYQNNSSLIIATLVVSIFLLSPATSGLYLVGLETVIYAFFLLVTFLAGSNFINYKTTKYSVIFSLLLFFTFLIRPEVFMIYPVAVLVYLFYRRSLRNPPLKPLVLGAVFLFILVGTYLLWKLYYFGDVLPNPFYIKAAGGSLISEIGMKSAISFLTKHGFLIGLTVVSFILNYKVDNKDLNQWNQVLILGLFFGILNIAFFVHTDTLMDIQGRFLYPLLPILIYINIPILTRIFGIITNKSKKNISLTPVVFIAFLIVITPYFLKKLPYNIYSVMSSNANKHDNSLMQKEYYIAKKLSSFPNIKQTKIAFGDAGVLPYFSQAIWLDTVGLNDTFISRNKNTEKIVNYLFRWDADMIIMPGNEDNTWLDYGHGPLGNVPSWAKDSRFDKYKYIGTSKTSGPYNLHYFIKDSTGNNINLTLFMKKYVVDGWYKGFPISIGTYRYDKEISPIWVQSVQEES
jgi:arabinofuranosyltransferase